MKIVPESAVISSASRTTTSVFDFVTTTATVAEQLVGTMAKGIDALNHKVDLIHASVVIETQATKVGMRHLTIQKAATDYVDQLEELSRRNGEPFDRSAALAEILPQMIQAVTA